MKKTLWTIIDRLISLADFIFVKHLFITLLIDVLRFPEVHNTLILTTYKDLSFFDLKLHWFVLTNVIQIFCYFDNFIIFEEFLETIEVSVKFLHRCKWDWTIRKSECMVDVNIWICDTNVYNTQQWFQPTKSILKALWS